MDTAPFYQEVADGPDGGAAYWLRTADDLRIRIGVWPHDGAKGTVLIFPGRTEYVEKYGRAARDFQSRGYASIAVDWRGQGLADRMMHNPAIGHVAGFKDYQHDVAAVVAHVKALGLPEPYYLVAHSMGGCIGLRALIEGLPVKAAMFSAPMWGINMSSALRPFAWGVSSLSRALGFDERISPGQSDMNYLQRVTLDENQLTNDADMFAFMQNQIATHPDLGLGGPSLRWLNESLREMRRLSQLPTPHVPALTYLGTDETIVDPARIRQRMGRWPDGMLKVIHGGRHEMLMDAPDMRNPIFDETAAFFDQHR